MAYLLTQAFLMNTPFFGLKIWSVILLFVIFCILPLKGNELWHFLINELKLSLTEETQLPWNRFSPIPQDARYVGKTGRKKLDCKGALSVTKISVELPDCFISSV